MQRITTKPKTTCSTTPVQNIEQADTLKILGVTFQSSGRFVERVKATGGQTDRREYLQPDIDYLFTSSVLLKITYGLPVYAAATAELSTVQNFLTICFNRRYIYEINVLGLLEKADQSLFKKVSGAIGHPLFTSFMRARAQAMNEYRGGEMLTEVVVDRNLWMEIVDRRWK